MKTETITLKTCTKCKEKYTKSQTSGLPGLCSDCHQDTMERFFVVNESRL